MLLDLSRRRSHVGSMSRTRSTKQIVGFNNAARRRDLPRRGRAPSITVAVASLFFSIAVSPISASASDPPADIAEVLSRVDSVLARIGELRGLHALSPVERAAQDRETLGRRLRELIETEYTAAEIDAEERFVKALGLIEPDADWRSIVIGVLEDQIAGYYDHEEDTFFLLDDQPLEAQLAIMSHELVHAIQDQHWDLDAFNGDANLITDASIARGAVVEGDAMAVMISYASNGNAILANSTLFGAATATMRSATVPDNTAPPFVWAQLTFPYVDGLALIGHLFQQAGWGAVNELYDDPPQSTEQIIHPNRYTSRDHPTWLSFELSALGYHRYMADVFGEYMTAAVLKQLLDDSVLERSVRRATSGWDGDRFDAFSDPTNPQRDLLVQLSAWDTIEDARQYRRVVSRLGTVYTDCAQPIEAEGEHGHRDLWLGSHDAVLVERWGDLVLLIIDRQPETSPTASDLLSMAEEVWRTHNRSSYPPM